MKMYSIVSRLYLERRTKITLRVRQILCQQTKDAILMLFCSYSLQTSTTEERNEWIAAMNKVRDFAQTASQLLQEWEKDQECHNCIQGTSIVSYCLLIILAHSIELDLAPIVEKDEMMASSEDDDKQAGMLHVCIPIRAI